MQPGTHLGHYEVISALGKGGMGEVWRAKDTKLGRDVAIKTLPAEFAQDAERLARFEREAKLLASLNHPNIAAIYGLEEHEGSRFLVLELVAGDTLGDRIKRGAIPVEESLRLALQIADALKAAHESGVIHRDLKPDNIKVSDDGNVKVLDFGLAKALAADDSEVNASNSPTLSMAATQAGMILGTAAYMSPEQAKGRTVDRRADVWAFGCVLYEMLTGRQSFGASDVTESLAAVIRAEPDWNSLPSDLHPRLQETVERCLEKPAAKRYQDIGDVKVDIEKVLADPSGAVIHSVTETVQAAPLSKLAWVAALVLAAVIGGIVVWIFKPGPTVSVARFKFTPPAEASVSTTGNYPDLAISPDGGRIAYMATPNMHLYVRSLDATEPVELLSQGQTRSPFFSPDGSQVAFRVQTDDSLRRVSIQGGAQQTIVADVSSTLRGASWGPDNTIVYATGDSVGLLRVLAAGGEPSAVTTPDEDGAIHLWPEFLPNGRGVLFTAWSGSDETSQIRVLDLETGVQHLVVSGGSYPRYAATGHVVYALRGTLRAVPFDVDSFSVTGESILVIDNVDTKNSGAANFDVSDNGVLIYTTGADRLFDTGGVRSLAWLDRESDEQAVSTPPGRFDSVALSTDGSDVLVSIEDETGQSVWVSTLNRGTLDLLTTEEGRQDFPLWTPDGERFLFGASGGLYSKSADGTGTAEPLFVENSWGAFVPGASSWAQDGETLVFVYPENNVDIGVIDVAGDGPWEPLLDSPFSEQAPAISPDGGLIAYTSDRTGQDEVYVERFPELGDRRPISTGGGWQPAWSPRGDELFFLRPNASLPAISGADAIMAVTVETTPELAFGTPGPIVEFETRYFIQNRPRRMYAVSPQGDRFLMIRLASATAADAANASDSDPMSIEVVLNWFEELKERVPVP